MKYSLFIFFTLLFFSCNSTKKVETNGRTNLQEIQLEEGCPERGRCTIEILKNTSLTSKEDSAGMPYPDFTIDSTTSVIKFEYSKTMGEAVADGDYREELYFQISESFNEIDIQGKDLSEVKLLFGRFCYCNKDAVGYFKIQKGSLMMKETKLSLEIETENIPHVIKKIIASYQ